MRSHSFVRASLAFAFLAGTALSAAAADIAVESHIAAVTVFPQGATVTRALTFNAPAGASVLVLGGLPGRLDPSTLRVDGAADSAIDILSVGTAPEDEDPKADEAREGINEAIQALQDEFSALDDRVASLEAQRQFVQNLITEAPKGFADRLGQVGAATDQWDTAWRAIGAGVLSINGEVRQIRADQARINERIGDQNRLLSLLPPVRDHVEVRIEISAAAAAEGALTLTYRSDDARWAPAYDAELTIGDAAAEPRLHLVRRAQVTQATGEDWVDVDLTLSTARPSAGMRAPSLAEAIVQQGYDDRRYDMLAGAPAAPRFAAPADGFQDAREQEAVVDFGDFRAEYKVPTPTSVATDEGSRSLRLASEDITVKLSVQATPRLAEQAFLHAEFLNPAGAPILPGAVSLFRDGAYVGADNVPFYAPGAEVSLGFGADDQVRIGWNVREQVTGERGLLARERTDERHYRIDVANMHTRPVEITVYDRDPVSTSDDVTVTRLDDTTPPTKENFTDRRGVMAWTYTYEPGQTREILHGYMVAYPSDQVMNWGD